jgi:hypothetical protein
MTSSSSCPTTPGSASPTRGRRSRGTRDDAGALTLAGAPVYLAAGQTVRPGRGYQPPGR